MMVFWGTVRVLMLRVFVVLFFKTWWSGIGHGGLINSKKERVRIIKDINKGETTVLYLLTKFDIMRCFRVQSEPIGSKDGRNECIQRDMLHDCVDTLHDLHPFRPSPRWEWTVHAGQPICNVEHIPSYTWDCFLGTLLVRYLAIVESLLTLIMI